MRSTCSIRRLTVFGVTSLFCAVAARGSVIDFNTLTGTNGQPFATYTENGYTVTATQGSWSKAFNFGNPIPDVFCDQCSPGTVSVTSSGGLFFFESVDLGDAQVSADNFTIQGFRQGSLVLSQSGSINMPSAFETVASVNSTVALDELFITLTSQASSFDYNIDNIVVNTAAPEPGTMALLGIALGAAAVYRLRRKAA